VAYPGLAPMQYTKRRSLAKFFADSPGQHSRLSRSTDARSPPRASVHKIHEEYAVCGRQVGVVTWKLEGAFVVDLLWLCFHVICWPVHEHGVAYIASSLCVQHKAKLVALTFGAVRVDTTTALSDFCMGLAEAIDAMALSRKFVVVDETYRWAGARIGCVQGGCAPGGCVPGLCPVMRVPKIIPTPPDITPQPTMNPTRPPGHPPQPTMNPLFMTE